MLSEEKFNRILERGTPEDRPGRGRTTSVVTDEFIEEVEDLVHLQKGQSQRKIVEKLHEKNIHGKRTSVQKAIDKLGLQPYRRVKTQKLSLKNKQQRVLAAQILRTQFGYKKGRTWLWNKLINTDFSGIFTFQPFQNSKNDVIYARSRKEIPPALLAAPKDKYPKGIMFWGAISYYGLIPAEGPINFTEWLKNQRQPGQHGRMYMNGERYAKFLREVAIPAVAEVVGDIEGEDVYWQDDQDTKQRTAVATDTVNEFFVNRVERDCDGKFADVWPIENVWGILKEKVRGKTFANSDELIESINEEWQNITVTTCKSMIDKIPSRLKKVIDAQGEQVC